MDQEAEALLFLKKAYRLGSDDNSLQRASEYEKLRGGHAFFFRNGKGSVFEVFPEWNTINCYSEDSLQEELQLSKYKGKTMTKAEVMDIIQNEDIARLLHSDEEYQTKRSAVRAMLCAFGYSKDWIEEMFLSEFDRSKLHDASSTN